MKKLSIKSQLKILITTMIFNFVLLAATTFWSVKNLGHEIHATATVEVPALKKAILTDMMHDGIRANAYGAIIESKNKDPEKMKEVVKESEEFYTNIDTYLKDLEALDLNPEIKESIKNSKAKLGSYIAAAKDIVTLSSGGKADEALTKVPAFQTAFEDLEKVLGAQNDLIEKEVDKNQEHGEIVSKRSNILASIVTLFGIVASLVISAWIMKNLINSLSSVTKLLNIESNNVKNASGEMTDASNKLSSSATQQASAVHETVSAIEEMTAMTKKSSESAERTREISQENQRTAESGQQSVEQMSVAIRDINESNNNILKQVEDSNVQLTEIVKVINDISNKTKVINDIVFQTKLLSFNASVEAARAGEHGKGFAVVAEEIGNLAQMSGTAANEIGEMLSNSISKVEGIVVNTKSQVEKLVSEGKLKIETGVKIARECGEILGKIVTQANEVDTLINEISTASSEQNQGINEVNKAIGEFDKTTKMNAATAGQNSNLASMLQDQSNNLIGCVKTLEALVGIVNDEVKKATVHKLQKNKNHKNDSSDYRKVA